MYKIVFSWRLVPVWG